MTSQGQVSHAMMSQSQNVMVSQGQPIMSQQSSQQQQQFQQQQQQQQQQMRNNNRPLPPLLVQYLEHYQLNPALLKLPEAEHLLASLNNGTYPVENILHQLSNPALQPRQRELILSVLKIRTMSQHLPPPLMAMMAASSTAAGHDHLLSHPPPPPQSRVSPLIFGGAGGAANHLSVSPGPQSQRVPSPQEMTVLTQQILQQALIKKKLEEQKENYRKKQEVKGDDEVRVGGGAVDKVGPSSGSPLLAFTPTSVMRKNAAERKDSDPRPGVPELKISGGGVGGGPEAEAAAGPTSPGRPILKSKASDRPESLEVGGGRVGTRGSLAGQPIPPPQPPHHMLAGGGGGQPGMPPPGVAAINPLMFLQNPQLHHGVPPVMLGQGGLGFGAGVPSQGQPHNGNLGGLSSLFNGGSGPGAHFQHPGLMAAGPPGPATGLPGLRIGPPSPRAQAAPPSPGGGGSLSRFFSNDVLAAAGSSSRQMKMPPLPTGQALTLEEIERQAATVKI